ncbi:hypothetical protein JF50_14045 [Pseudoalteromonas luteoviolacea]|uniref:GIY-YIG domain-containing protein n=1 Tax=Pseudoalteromonas luteoviolacea TaxID=43657 RepID=A0A0C1Q8I6_9GAMM|nr:GIY-YIG nuclease family protein [Pseudoalteromonas luteoviolacea]KID56986.1 hypothetical protein JF50_14045 [Pseudoalteromonas luteoviolacea]
MNLKRIFVYWSEPYAIKYCLKENVYNLCKDTPKEISQSFGVYQIYGDHPIYGLNVLLYIGMTQLSNKRNFEKRIQEHLDGRFWQHHGLSVRFGEIYHKQDLVTDVQQIKDVESLLIASNMPALNRHNIDKASNSCTNLLVRNDGFRGSIVPECSGEFWC